MQEYLAQPSVSSNEKLCQRYQKELLLAHCNLLRITLSENNVQPSLDALRRYFMLRCQDGGIYSIDEMYSQNGGKH